MLYIILSPSNHEIKFTQLKFFEKESRNICGRAKKIVFGLLTDEKCFYICLEDATANSVQIK